MRLKFDLSTLAIICITVTLSGLTEQKSYYRRSDPALERASKIKS